jgi:hypothetical protein
MDDDTQPSKHRLSLSRPKPNTVIGSVVAAAMVAIAAFQGVSAFKDDPATVVAGGTAPDKVAVSLLDRLDVEGVRIGEDVYVPAKAVDEAFDLDQEKTDNGVRLANTLRLPVIATAHDPKGNWLGADRTRVEEWGSVKMDDATGLPKFVHDNRQDFLPITVAHYGLEHYSLWAVQGNADDLAKAVKAADWFVDNQESSGGWPALFDFEFQPGMTDTLKSGWYSGMSQGMAADLLAKIYDKTKTTKYRTAALKGLNPLTVSVENGGVQRMFEGEYQWWEEYPTRNRPTYVLNGFIYCLIGTYDVAKLLNDSRAQQLYESGLRSLTRMVNLYDLGSHTSYDLLHYSVPGTPPNIARWDYHNLHVELLSTLNVITEGQFKDVQARWYGYVKGVSAPHN